MVEPMRPLGADLLFRPVRSRGPFEDTFEQLRLAIELGVVAPGHRLPPERVLATKLRVARSTVREAIRVLAEKGFVEVRRGRTGGSFARVGVLSISVAEARRLALEMGDQLRDALALRGVIEPVAAAMAAERAQPPDRARIATILAEALAAPGASYRQADARLHLAVVEAAHSPLLAQTVLDLQARLGPVLAVFPELTVSARRSQHEHSALARAIVQGDAMAARQAMAEHVNASADVLRTFLDDAQGGRTRRRGSARSV
jgi:GntR family L-lactate dehydrogenase operon transcriptional regulator